MAYAPFPETFPELVGDGLVLRELSEADLPAWFDRLSDLEAAALAGDPIATSMDTVVDGLAHHRAAFRGRTGLRWAIVRKDLRASVGSIGLGRFNQNARSAEIGAAIGRAHWGRGIATGAGRLVTQYAFGSLALQAIEAVVLPENSRALRVLEKLGFSKHPRSCPPERYVSGRADSELLVLAAAEGSAVSAPRRS